jgi:hypothetical protein
VEQLQAIRSALLNSMNVMFATRRYISGVTMNYVATRSLEACRAVLHPPSPQQSPITRGRQPNRDQVSVGRAVTHLFWIDSDIVF